MPPLRRRGGNRINQCAHRFSSAASGPTEPGRKSSSTERPSRPDGERAPQGTGKTATTAQHSKQRQQSRSPPPLRSTAIHPPPTPPGVGESVPNKGRQGKREARQPCTGKIPKLGTAQYKGEGAPTVLINYISARQPACNLHRSRKTGSAPTMHEIPNKGQPYRGEQSAPTVQKLLDSSHASRLASGVGQATCASVPPGSSSAATWNTR